MEPKKKKKTNRNPIPRLRRMLGLKAGALPKLLGLERSWFGRLSAEMSGYLQTEISKRWLFGFARKVPQPTGIKLSGKDKREAARMLLNTDVQKRYSPHGYGMQPVKDLVIFSGQLPQGGFKFIISDMPLGTPLSPMGNLLTHEFLHLITVDPESVEALGKITQTVQVDIQAVLLRCHALNPTQFTFDLWKRSMGGEAQKRFNDNQLAAILVHVEYHLCLVIFGRLRRLESRKDRLQEEEKQLRRYRDWFIHQFCLDQPSYEAVLRSGKLVLLDKRTVETKVQRRPVAQPRDVQVALVFEQDISRLQAILPLVKEQCVPGTVSEKK